MSDNSITIGANTITFSDGTNTRTITLDATNNTVSFATAAVSGASFEAGVQVSAVGGSGGGLGGSATGGVASFTITVSGSGWGVNETGDFIAKTGNGTGAAFTVTSVDANTGITGLTVTSAGSGFAVNDILYADEEEEGETRPEIRVDSVA